MSSRIETPSLRSAQAASPAETPTLAQRAGRVATDMALSVATGLAADRLRASLLSRGNATAAIVGLAGGALLKTAATGTITVVANLRNGKTATAGLSEKLLDAARTGTIDAGLTLAARPLHDAVGSRWTQLTQLGTTAVTGTLLGAAGGLALTGTDRHTWGQGIAEGVKAVGAATVTGAVGGGVLGTVTGVVVNRLMPAPGAAAVNAHQVRTLQWMRTKGISEKLAPEAKTSWAHTMAFTKQVSQAVRQGRASLTEMAQSQPEVQAFLKSLKPGDVLLIGRGSTANPQGMTTLLPRSPYGHAMMVAEANGDGTGTIIHATGLKGVVQQSFDEALSRYLPSPAKPRMALTLVRPTKDPHVAAAAITYAKSKLGAPYNYSMGAEGKAMFCSQLVHNAYDHNPVIGSPVFNILQLDENTTLLEAFQGVNQNGALTQINQRTLNGVYKEATPLAKAGLILEDAGKTVVGAVKWGVSKTVAAFSSDGGKVTAADYRSQVPDFVTPSELHLADGRSLHTLMIEYGK